MFYLLQFIPKYGISENLFSNQLKWLIVLVYKNLINLSYYQSKGEAMKRLPLTTIIVTCLLLLLTACAPGKPPAPSPTTSLPTPSAGASTQTSPTSNLPPPTTQDAAWSKVVDAAKQEGKVTIYSFTFIGDLGIALGKAFKESQGINLEVVSGSGAVFMERIKTESRANKNVADILEGSSTNATLAKQSNLSQTYDSLPVLKESGVWVFDPRADSENHILYYNPIIQTAWANTKLVSSAEEPRSWRDFLDPKWKGKILASDPNVMPINNQLYIMLTRYLNFDNEYFRALSKQDLIIVPTARDRASKLARGEAPLAWVDTLASVSNMVVEGAPIKPLDMKEGVLGSAQSLNIVNGAPHPNASRVFMNWLLTKEGQTAQARIRNLMPLRTDVPDFTPPSVSVKYTKVVLITAKDDEDAAKAMREQVLGKLWGR